jgi:glycosyltransferase involved in cell wall biosynthesis
VSTLNVMADSPPRPRALAGLPACARVGVLALAREGHGGTLPYTRAMIEALKRLRSDRYRFTLYTHASNAEYDDVGWPIVRLPDAWRTIRGRLSGRDVFEGEQCVVAPIYSPHLLATRVPFVFTLHDLQEKHYPGHFTMATRAWRHAMNRLLTGRAAAVICESDFVRKDIVEHFQVPLARVNVMPAPPSSQLSANDMAPEVVAEILRALGIDRRYVFYPAQFWPHKNHVRLVEAFAVVARTHPDCMLVLTGKCRDEYTRVFRRIRELDLETRVRHVGHVDARQLAALYRGATITAVPTLFESISIPVYEAFALGSAVCASNVVALPEQIGDAGLLFNPTSPRDIADAIRRLLDDEPLRRALVANGFRRMSSVTHETYAARLGGLLDSIVGENAQAAA